MTKEEFCEKYNYSTKTLKTSFGRIQQAMKNKGYLVSKQGSWPNTEYSVIEDKTLIPKKEVVLSDRLVGQRFGHLEVKKDTGKRIHRSIIWECLCDCGNIHEVSSNNLNSGNVNSCGKMECPYHKTYKDLTGKTFGKLTAIKPTTMKDGSHMYWLCICECGNTHEVASNHLQSGSVQSCGCIKTSIGEMNIQKVLEDNNIVYMKEYSFSDLKNKKVLRFDFAIIENSQVVRLIEFDGIQHFKEQDYFTHNLTETKNNDNIKNEYCKANNIPLVRIPYQLRDKITLDMLLGKEYLIE